MLVLPTYYVHKGEMMMNKNVYAFSTHCDKAPTVYPLSMIL